MHQLSIFDNDTGLTGQFQAGVANPVAPLARATDPASSYVAAKQFVQSGALKGHEETLVWCSDSMGTDWTYHEMAKYSERTGSPLNDVQVARRVAGLREKQVLEQCPYRKCKCGCGRVVITHKSKRV